MPHIAVTMLPGRDRETKQKLAENLCNTLIETLGVYKPQNKMFRFYKTFCSRITLINTNQNVILNPI